MSILSPTPTRGGRSPLPPHQRKKRHTVYLTPAVLRILAEYAEPQEGLGTTIERFVLAHHTPQDPR